MAVVLGDQAIDRPGGRIGLASWTPRGLGQLLRVVARHVPPIAGVASPLLWGTDTHTGNCSTERTSITLFVALGPWKISFLLGQGSDAGTSSVTLRDADRARDDRKDH
jgi:hypothetical protein